VLNQPHLYAGVIVDIRISQVDRMFFYLVPESLRHEVKIGQQVVVPFGKRNVNGYIVELQEEDPDLEGIKSIHKICDTNPLFTLQDILVAKWMKERYLCPLVTAMQCFQPPGTVRKSLHLEKKVKMLQLILDPQQAIALGEQLKARAPRQYEGINRLLDAPGYSLLMSGLVKEIGYGSVKALIEKNWVLATQTTQRRIPQEGLKTSEADISSLTSAQIEALSQAEKVLDSSEVKSILLHGVTGSGKTEVYLRVIEAALKRGLDAIVLVPEISLTPQTVGRFQKRFGPQIAVLHSRLSQGERFDEWMRLKNGQARIAIGARSAVFAPLADLGLIIIDEEHEDSYKQDETPRYQAKEVAWQRLVQNNKGRLLMLGSATPSLESYYQARRGNLIYISMPERVEKRPMPANVIVDMRQELLEGNRSIFSRQLLAKLTEVVNNQEQAILFLNRRGFAQFLLCRSCGYIPRCPSCGVSYTYHQRPEYFLCHYCDRHQSMYAHCPECNSRFLRPFGMGTQKVEEEVARYFPNVKVLRMDKDTTTAKNSHQKILQAFSNKEADILIGTQMVAKGHDFPGVTLVGVLCADTALHFPDYRASEKTFQLLTQVSGRAGRGNIPGFVVIQTYSPSHYAIQAAGRYDYSSFAQRELNYRQRTKYPPFVEIARILITGEEEKVVINTANQLAISCQKGLKSDWQIIGPAPCPLSKLKNRFRWHILIKGDKHDINRVLSLGMETDFDMSVSVLYDVGATSLL
jgi:primosomal protein N' (replication factor Y)